MKINVGIHSFELSPYSDEGLEIILSKEESPSNKALKISVNKNGIIITEEDTGFVVRGPTNWTDAICNATLQRSYIPIKVSNNESISD